MLDQLHILLASHSQIGTVSKRRAVPVQESITAVVQRVGCSISKKDKLLEILNDSLGCDGVQQELEAGVLGVLGDITEVKHVASFGQRNFGDGVGLGKGKVVWKVGLGNAANKGSLK